MSNYRDEADRVRVLEITRSIVGFMAQNCAEDKPYVRLNALIQVALAELAVNSGSVDTMRRNLDTMIRGLQDNCAAIEIAWAESRRDMPRGSEAKS